MFRERGFDQTTTAEIAKKAGVGPGTLFRYVRDKNELLLLVIQDDLRQATNSGTEAVATRGSLTARLVRLYRPRFEFWASNMALTKSASDPILAGEWSGVQASFSRIGRSQARLLNSIAGILTKHAVDTGLTMRNDATVIAQAVHYMYIGELRAWINEPQPCIEAALANLEQHFDLLIYGIFSTPGHAG